MQLLINYNLNLNWEELLTIQRHFINNYLKHDYLNTCFFQLLKK